MFFCLLRLSGQDQNMAHTLSKQSCSTRSSVDSKLGDVCILISLLSFCSFPVLMTQPYFWSWTHSLLTSLVLFMDNNRYESLLWILLNVLVLITLKWLFGVSSVMRQTSPSFIFLFCLWPVVELHTNKPCR